MAEQEKVILSAEKPIFAQEDYYCPYCKSLLMYLWNNGRLIGLGLDRWLCCEKCKNQFKIGIYGIEQQELSGYNFTIEYSKKTES